MIDFKEYNIEVRCFSAFSGDLNILKKENNPIVVGHTVIFFDDEFEEYDGIIIENRIRSWLEQCRNMILVIHDFSIYRVRYAILKNCNIEDEDYLTQFK